MDEVERIKRIGTMLSAAHKSIRRLAVEARDSKDDAKAETAARLVGECEEAMAALTQRLFALAHGRGGVSATGEATAVIDPGARERLVVVVEKPRSVGQEISIRSSDGERLLDLKAVRWNNKYLGWVTR